MTYTLEQAQSNLAQLLAEAREGKEVVIESEGMPTLRLDVTEVAAPTSTRQPRVLGLYAGQFNFPEELLKPLETDEELREYGFDIMIDGKSADSFDPFQ